MKVHISPDQKAFIREAIESGRFRKEEDALQEALALWKARERVRAEILGAVAKAEDSIARGEGRIITRASLRAFYGNGIPSPADGATPAFPKSRGRVG